VSIAIVEDGTGSVVVAGPRPRSVLALTRIESRRLITHPAILAPPALILLLGVRGPGVFRFFFLVGIGYFALGIGTFVAANLCASRSRRNRTEELYRSLPLRPADRTIAHLLSVAVPLVVAMVIGGALAASTRPWAGASVRLDIEPRTIMHGLPDFALGPLLVAFLGVAGVVLARWFSTPVAFPVVFGGIFAINSLTGLAAGALRWLNPAADYSSAGLVSASVMPWHLVYVAGLVLVLALAALVRRPLARGLRLYGAVAVAITGVGALMQVLAARS
jgi:hypothetical protein